MRGTTWGRDEVIFFKETGADGPRLLGFPHPLSARPLAAEDSLSAERGSEGEVERLSAILRGAQTDR